MNEMSVGTPALSMHGILLIYVYVVSFTTLLIIHGMRSVTVVCHLRIVCHVCHIPLSHYFVTLAVTFVTMTCLTCYSDVVYVTFVTFCLLDLSLALTGSSVTSPLSKPPATP